MFAEVVGDSVLGDDVRALARHHKVDADLDAVTLFATTGQLPPPEHPASSVLLTLAGAVSPSPAEVSAQMLSAFRTANCQAKRSSN